MESRWASPRLRNRFPFGTINHIQNPLLKLSTISLAPAPPRAWAPISLSLALGLPSSRFSRRLIFKELGHLEHKAIFRISAVFSYSLMLEPPTKNFAFIDIIETGCQTCHGEFSAPEAPTKATVSPFVHFERHIVQHLFSFPYENETF